MTYAAADHRATPVGSVPGRSRSAVPVEYAPHALATLVGFIGLALGSPGAGLGLISLTAAVFACWMAIVRGGRYFLPSSVFMLAGGVFVGGAGYYLGRLNDLTPPIASVRDAAGLALLTTVGISVVTIALSNRWGLSWKRSGPFEGDEARTFRSPKHFELKALLMLGLSQVPPIESALGPIATALGFGAVMMMTLSAASKRVRLRWYGDALVVAVAFLVPMLWVELMFTGGGRLTVAGLGIASFVGWNLVRPHRIQKVLVILAIPVFLAFAGLDRIDGTASTGSVVGDGDGLASVYSPLETWARIIEPKPGDEAAKLGPRFGETFLFTFYLPIPRGVWEDKPAGFGAELTEVFEPDLVDDNHSMAALVHGEFFANFGYLGLLILIPAAGCFLAVLDRTHNRLVESRLSTTASWWSAATLLCICGSLGDLYWVGTFMIYARGGLAALVVWMVGKLSTGRVINPAKVAARQQGERPPVQDVRARSTRGVGLP